MEINSLAHHLTAWLIFRGHFRQNAKYSDAPQYRISRDQQISSVINGLLLLPIQEIQRYYLKELAFIIGEFPFFSGPV